MRGPFPIALAALLAACIVEAPSEGTSQQPARRGRAAPPTTARLEANLGDEVLLERIRIEPGRLMAGEQVKVTLSLRALADLDRDYWVFVHVEDPDGRLARMNLDHAPGGGRRPTSLWRRGEVVEDAFLLYLPPGVAVRRLNLWGGIWEPKTDARLELRNLEGVRHDGQNRILLAQVPAGRP